MEDPAGMNWAMWVPYLTGVIGLLIGWLLMPRLVTWIKGKK